ncbi:MAG: tripartite tricarboxylate transporter substrate binding protein [Betaproteobacteria bacterium]
MQAYRFSSRCAVLCGAVMVAMMAVPVAAQTYPNKPIRIIVGPGPDVLSRIIGQKFTEAWGQQTVVDQRPGGGGVISAELASKAPADGYTLLMITSSYTINAVLQKTSYDLVRDFSPIALCVMSPYILSANLALPARNIHELIALAKAKPGQLNYASAGNGTGPHLAGEMLKNMAKIDLVHIVYKGAAPAMIDLMGGQVQLLFQTGPGSLAQIKAGKIRALAVTSAVRSPQLPDLPTMIEAGMPGFEANGWNGLVAPAGTPKALIAKLSTEVTRVMKDPVVLQKITETGWEPVTLGATPEQFAKFISTDIARYAKVIKDTGAKVD